MNIFVDIILGVIALASLGYVIVLIVKHFPELSGINVDRIPERKQENIKRQLLEEKLRRDFSSRWGQIKKVVITGRGQQVTKWASGVYDRLKNLEQEYRVARKKDLSSHVSKTKSVEEMISEARDLINAQDYQRAEQLLIEALKLDDQNTRVYLMLAQTYRDKGDVDHAKETLEFLVQLTDSKDPSVYSNLGSLALERGDLSTAQEDYQRSISLDPDNYKHHFELAEVYVAMGDTEQAQEAAQKALSFSPNNPKILDFLIENSIILQDKNRADEYLSKLIDVNPENGKIVSFKSRISELG